jgi:hypothetical protein
MLANSKYPFTHFTISLLLLRFTPFPRQSYSRQILAFIRLLSDHSTHSENADEYDEPDTPFQREVNKARLGEVGERQARLLEKERTGNA